MTKQNLLVIICLAGCNIGPRVSVPDAARPPDAPPDAPSGFKFLLPAGTDVPSIGTDAALVFQIKENDGISDAAAILARSNGKAGGVAVKFWNFGPAPVELNIGPPATIFLAVMAPVYVIGRIDQNNVFQPILEHPRLIDTVPGDPRYSPIRRVINVPVRPTYKGELITTVAALNEAIELELVDEPVPDGTWVNMPVVIPTQLIEVSGTGPGAVTLPPTQVYGRGFKVDVFELGTSLGRQPLRAAFPPHPIGNSSSIFSGVGPIKPTTPDNAGGPVFQFAIPSAAPTSFSYTPVSQDVSVRLANGVAPAAATSDVPDLYTRATLAGSPPNSGAITGYNSANVESITVNATFNNFQLQYADGAL
jgi:hypothetical protein